MGTSNVSRVFVDANPTAGQPIQIIATSSMGRRAFAVDEANKQLLLFDVDNQKTVSRWPAS